MTAAVWLASAAAGWLVLSGVVGVAVGRMLRRRGEEPALDVTDQSRCATNTR